MLKKYRFDPKKFKLGMRTFKTGLAVFIKQFYRWFLRAFVLPFARLVPWTILGNGHFYPNFYNVNNYD